MMLIKVKIIKAYLNNIIESLLSKIVYSRDEELVKISIPNTK